MFELSSQPRRLQSWFFGELSQSRSREGDDVYRRLMEKAILTFEAYEEEDDSLFYVIPWVYENNATIACVRTAH